MERMEWCGGRGRGGEGKRGRGGEMGGGRGGVSENDGMTLRNTVHI